jgi:hypothetical protein
MRNQLCFRPGDNEDMYVVRTVRFDVIDFFVNVPLHASAERRVKLRDIADLQEICEFRFAICDSASVAESRFLLMQHSGAISIVILNSAILSAFLAFVFRIE